jgi:opacity protein-like surface antigen
MKNYLKTAAVVALSVGLTLGLTGAASADGKALTGGSYIGLYGGANWDDVISSKFVDDNSGYTVGAVVGTRVNAVKGLRIEADLSTRQNDVDIFGGKISAQHETNAILGNVVYDVPVELGPVHPYVLAGLGYAKTTATFEDVSLLKLEASGVAWQLGAGINTQIADGVTAGVGYRYMQGPAIEVLNTELSDGSNHSVVASVNFAF